MLFGGENWERFEIGMWFGCGLEGEFLKTRGGGWEIIDRVEAHDHVEDNEYLGSRENGCLAALPVGVHGGRRGTRLSYYCRSSPLDEWV